MPEVPSLPDGKVKAAAEHVKELLAREGKENLYELRKDVVRRYGKKGIIAGGHIPDFEKHKHEMSAATYVEKVVAGELYDRTLTFQLENGFEAPGVIENYIADAEVDNWASLIVWRNPDR